MGILSRFKYLLVFLLFCAGGGAVADDFVSPPHAISAIGENARFEILGSQIVVRDTFRLDRVCGNVDQLVKTKAGDFTWEDMPVERRPSCTNDSKPHYQLYLSSITVKNSFLMNTDNGITWALEKNATDDTVGWFLLSK